MPSWVVVGVLAALAVVPSRAMAADCADIGVPGQYDVFVGGTLTANTGGATIQGRVAAGGDARVQGITLGTNPPLTPDTNRADLVVGRNLTVEGGGGSVPFGRVTYGGTLAATGTLTALGGLHQAQPPFDFAAETTTLSERSAQWADLPANGTIGGSGSYDNPVHGHQPDPQRLRADELALQGYGQITISVPPGSTTLINIEGKLHERVNRMDLVGATPERSCGTSRRVRGERPRVEGDAAGPQRRPRLSYGQVHELARGPRRHARERWASSTIPSLAACRPAAPTSAPVTEVAVHRPGDQPSRPAPAQQRPDTATRPTWRTPTPPRPTR